MKSALTLWANLEAARDNSSMNLSYELRTENTLFFRSDLFFQYENQDGFLHRLTICYDRRGIYSTPDKKSCLGCVNPLFQKSM